MRDQDRIAEIVQALRGCMADIAFSDDMRFDLATNKAARVYHATADADRALDAVKARESALLALVQQWREEADRRQSKLVGYGRQADGIRECAAQLERLITGEGK